MGHGHAQEQTYIQNYIYIDIPLYTCIQCIPDLTVKLLPCGIWDNTNHSMIINIFVDNKYIGKQSINLSFANMFAVVF